MRLLFLVVAFLPVTGFAQQRFSVGLLGGVPVQTPLGRSESMPFQVGPTLEVKLLGWLSVETGFLYHRNGRRIDELTFLGPETSVTLLHVNERGSALEFPAVLKMRFRNTSSGWRPFLMAGPTVRRTFTRYEQFGSILGGSQLASGSSFAGSFETRRTQWNVDPAVGAGMDFRTGRFHLE